MSVESIKISGIPPISLVPHLSLSSTNTAISREGPKVLLMQIQSALLQLHLHFGLSAFVLPHSESE